ncbi:MAG: type ISP restriction/modification enzyme [Pseudonocardiaceae bacterium]
MSDSRNAQESSGDSSAIRSSGTSAHRTREGISVSKLTFPLVAPKLLPLLSQRLGLQIDGKDMIAYVSGVIAHSGYTEKFRDELRQPGVRIPLTAEPALWCEAVLIGKQVIWLHTFGERFDDNAAGRPLGQPSADRPGVVGSIPGRAKDIPESIIYDNSSQSLVLGSARIEPVSPAVAAYKVSRMRVIKHWFDYRRRSPAGRRGGSDLDELTAERWTRAMTEQLRDLVAVLEGCVKLEERQADVLDRIVAGPLITSADLENASVLPPPQGARRMVENDAGVTLF